MRTTRARDRPGSRLWPSMGEGLRPVPHLYDNATAVDGSSCFVSVWTKPPRGRYLWGASFISMESHRLGECYSSWAKRSSSKETIRSFILISCAAAYRRTRLWRSFEIRIPIFRVEAVSLSIGSGEDSFMVGSPCTCAEALLSIDSKLVPILSFLPMDDVFTEF